MGRPSRFSPEVRERAVRLVMEPRPAHPSEWAALQAVATKLGMTGETLRKWVRQAERDTGQRPGLTRRRPRFSPKRHSTAGPSRRTGGVYRRLSGPLRGRVDLQSPADRPIDVSPPSSPAGRADASISTCPSPRHTASCDSARVGRESSGLRSAQGVEAVEARGSPRRALHRGPPDACHGPARRCARTRVDHDDPRGYRGRFRRRLHLKVRRRP